jgi:hypothetical protein
MAEIPKNYPAGLTDNELIELISTYSESATVAGRPSTYSVGPSYWKEMAELGQNELNNRIQKNLLSEISNLKTEIILLKEDNKISGRINKWLALITIALAIITGYIGYLSLDAARIANSDVTTKKESQNLISKESNLLLEKIYNELKLSDSLRKKTETIRAK